MLVGITFSDPNEGLSIYTSTKVKNIDIPGGKTSDYPREEKSADNGKKREI